MSRDIVGSSGASHVRIARRILVSLAIGATTYGLTSLADATSSNDAALTALTLSVFLGGAVLVVQFLMEIDGRLRGLEVRQAAHESRVEGVVQGAFAQINEAARLFGLLEETAARSDAVTQMVRHAILIKPSQPGVVYDFAQSEIGRTSSFLKALAAGEATYEGEDRDWLIGLTDCTRSHIDATSFATVDAGGESFSDGFWHTPLGRRYLKAQSDAVHDRGVTVRRIFIFDKPDFDADSDFRDICAMQVAAGVDVRVLEHNRINQSLMDLRDFILFDGGVSYETVVSASQRAFASPSILNTKLVLDIGQIRKRVADFEYLWSLGEPISG
ncbi:DUF6879 family protein [Cryptosporangium arvum]|jgi:hypothetical protein|uniref:DUF6879 domain-containing protein n=1 Tax=Cryptosporangium arvum DSM 44712 TaxID=927661 RepID=A0A011ACX0_9ACTN|nr:DUF6879 family protein [Cryptosporangium arvum]EXG79901.1 hypothetical protein CryarDRAFT_0953 [Cryptosporangium arvum DSM 44712]